MPTITPRAEEWKPVLETLESDEYETGQAMAKAIVKQVFNLLAMRETHLLVVTDGNKHELVYGPFGSEAEVARLAKKIGGGSFQYLAVKTFPAGVLEGNLDGLPGGGFGYCRVDGCGHMQALHAIDGTSRGGCTECECAKFRK